MDSRARWTEYAVKVRWLLLLVIGLWGLLGDRWTDDVHRGALFGVVVLGAAYNVVATLLARRGYHFTLALPALLVDCLLIAMAVLHSGGARSPLFFLYLSPLVLGAMLFRLVGFAALTALVVLMHVVTASPDLVVGGPDRSLLLFHCLFFAITAILLLRVAGDRVLSETELEGIGKVARLLASREDRLASLPRILAGAAEAAGAQSLLLYRCDEPSGSLSPWPDPTADTLPPGPRAQELARKALETGETQVRHWGDESVGGVAHPAVVACLPLGGTDAPSGVLIAATADRLRTFSPQAVGFLELIAGEVSLLLRETALEDSLAAQSQTVDTLLRHLDSATLVADPDGHVIAANPAATGLLGIEPSQVVGRPMAEAVAHDEVGEILAHAARDRVPRSGEVRVGDGDEFTIRVEAAPVRNDDGRLLGYVATFVNVTELRRLESLQSQFTGAVSHELRTPLTSIKAYTATLLRDVDFDADTRHEFLTIINAQCDRLTELIDDLLDVSHIERGRALDLNVERVELEELLERVIDIQRGSTDRHTFLLDVAPEARTIRGDPHRLHQIFNNLVSNAVKYSPDGGEVVVRTRPEEQTVKIEVSDPGKGIAPEYQEAIFKRFYQVDGSTTRRVGGSGTGLYLVKHLVESHGGMVSVESALGAGSTFTVELPRNGPPGA